MQIPPRLPNEAERLRALRLLGVLDTLPERRFDRLTRLACRLFDVPIALVSLVDRDRQWFKSRQGLEVCETARDVSFCSHAIVDAGILQVSDATKDSRFADNPLVTGAPDVRFYAGAPLLTRDGHRVGTLCIIDRQPRYLEAQQLDDLRDLADCVQDELGRADLIEAKERAEETNRLKDEFLNMISHELRTPLTVLLGYLPLLQEVEALPPAELIAEMAGDMRQAGDHLLQVINDLLDLSRIESGKLDLHMEDVDTSDIAQTVFRQLKGKADEKGLLLENRVTSSVIHCDPLRLRQILINLVGNAIKFTDEGSILIESRETEDGTELSVVDSGIGIAKEDLPKIFDHFRQVDSTSTRKVGGSGLGLAITRRLVELHGGSIAVGSRLSEGSTFTVKLPERP